MSDPRVPSNFSNLPRETQAAMINAYRNERRAQSGSQLTNIFTPTSQTGKNNRNFASPTSGQVWAVGKVVAGSGLIIVGTITLPEGAPLIAVGIPILADGSASSFVEFVLNGDTSAVPPTINHAGILIIEGAIEAYTKKDKNCE